MKYGKEENENESARDSAQDRTIIARRQIEEISGVAEFKVCKRAKIGEKITDKGERILFLIWRHTVKGGAVIVHLRSEDPEKYRGKRIVVRFECWKRRYSDGSSNLFFDLYPTDERPTHILKIVCRKKEIFQVIQNHRLDRVSVFHTPSPTEGAIGLIRI